MLSAAEFSLKKIALGECEWVSVFQESMFYEMFLRELQFTNSSSWCYNLLWVQAYIAVLEG